MGHSLYTEEKVRRNETTFRKDISGGGAAAIRGNVRLPPLFFPSKVVLRKK
jgi:hypothetical protein